MKMQSKISGMVLVGVTAFALCAFGGTSTWKSTATGGWNDPDSWEGGVPDSTSTVVVPDNVDLPVYDADVTYAGAVSNITLGTGSRLVFDVTDNECTMAGTITGNGAIVKYGTNIVHLTNETVNGYYAKGGMQVYAGILECPQTFSGDWNGTIMNIGPLHVEEDAIFRPYSRFRSDLVSALTGKGQIQGLTANGYWPFRLGGSTYSRFEGRITGYIEVWAMGHYDLVGEESSFMGGLSFYSGSPDIGVMKLGKKDEGASSIGSGYYVSGGRKYRSIGFSCANARLRYLGTGEESNKDFSFSNANGVEGVIDAGATGGLVLTGTMSLAKPIQHIVVLDGSNTTVSALSGGWTEESDTNSAYLAKTGTGTWLVAGATDRRQKGVVGVEQGTLQFDSLTETNIPCSFGLSTLLAKKYKGAWDATKTADYAILLGSADSEGVLEWVGTNLWDNSSSTRPVAVTGRGGRIVSSVVGRRIGIRGAFAADAGGGTLTLDGDGTTNLLYNVSDGHGKMSLAKEGSGTWVLAGDQTFSGKLAVNEGEVIVSMTRSRKYSWYRFSIKKCSDNARVRIYEMALYDASGNRLNRGLTYEAGSFNTIPAAGQACYWGRSVNPSLATLFDGYAQWGSGNPYLYDVQFGSKPPYPEKPETWLQMVMRLDDAVASAAYYDLCAELSSTNSIPEFTAKWQPTAWTMEASADGVFWDKVADVADFLGTYSARHWFSDDKAFSNGQHIPAGADFAFGLDSGKSLITGTPNQLSNAVVSVASGAVLRAEGDVTICALEGGADGIGTIDGFSFAEDGTFNLTGVARLTDAVSVPVDFTNVTGAENISNWSLAIGGKHANGRLSYGDGRIRVTPIGTMFSIR